MIKTSTINLYGIPQSVNLMVKHVDAVSNTAPGTPAATLAAPDPAANRGLMFLTRFQQQPQAHAVLL